MLAPKILFESVDFKEDPVPVYLMSRFINKSIITEFVVADCSDCATPLFSFDIALLKQINFDTHVFIIDILDIF